MTHMVIVQHSLNMYLNQLRFESQIVVGDYSSSPALLSSQVREGGGSILDMTNLGAWNLDWNFVCI